MKSYKTCFALLAVVALGIGLTVNAAETEKEKAMSNPYPNDFGPAQIDEVVKDYPKDIQAGYKLLLVRCAQCHPSSRPLNSRFVEPSVGWNASPAEREGKETAAQAQMKKEHPEWLSDKQSWQIVANS